MVKFTREDITSASGGSKDSGKKFVRTLFFHHDPDDTMVDCINSSVMPDYNDCHPVYTAFYVTDIGDVQVHSDSEWYVEVTYSNKIEAIDKISKETEPWNLPPQNVSITTFDKEIPMKMYWNLKRKKFEPLLNSAGVPITATKTVTVGTLSFTMNVKKKSSLPVLNYSYTYNAETETVCNIKIPPLCGKLLPFGAKLHTVTDSNTGKTKYEYYSIDVTIQYILPTGDEGNESWAFAMLDVGTLCRDKDGNLGAIYKFRKARNKNELSTAPVVYGSIDELIIQRSTWNNGDMASFPYEEITELMPLNDGKLYMEAILSTDGSVPYGKIEGLDSEPASWSKYNLPKKR